MRERILLVDDEQPFCLTLKRALERRGYEVETAFDGRSAIALAEKTVFDLMVVDVRMPDINGLEALSAVKEAQPRIEGIVMTGYASYEAPVNAIKLGVRDYLGKPFELPNFLDSIERVLRQSREARLRRGRSARVRTAYLESLRLLARSFGSPSHWEGRPAAVARRLGLGEAQAEQVEVLVALSHLGRRDPLSALDTDQQKAHWGTLQQVLEPVEELRSLLPPLLALYERVDGTGFPDGLQGDEVPLVSRVVAAGVVWAEEGVERARHLAGQWLDPTVVTAFEAPMQDQVAEPMARLDERYASLLRLSTACRQAGDATTALQALTLASAAAARMGDPQKEASCLLQQAHLAVASGAAAEGRALLERAMQAARLAGPTVEAHARVEEAQLRLRLNEREEAEAALLQARSQFERWQWRYQATRATLLLADVYRDWCPEKVAVPLERVLREADEQGFDDMFVWEWAKVGPLVAAALDQPTDELRPRLLGVLARMGPSALRLWDGREVPPDVGALFLPGTEAPTGLRVQCLGEFRAGVGAADVADSAWHGRKVKNLFSYLVLQQGRLVSQDVLLEHFWPDSSEERGRHALHQAVHRLRKALETVGAAPYVVQQADTYGFNTRQPYALDLETFEKQFAQARSAMAQRDRGAAQQAWLEAERAYGGDLLSNAPYEDWCLDMREGFRRKYLEVLGALAVSYEEAGRADAAADYARRLFALDASREESARLLMRLLWSDGRRDDALRVYQQCRRVLEEEVGVAPLPETRSLFEKIAKGEVLVG